MSQMIKNFSYTQLDLLTKCGKAWEFRYVYKIYVPVNGELIRGDAYHKALAHAYTNIVIYKEAPPLDEVLSVYSDTWDKRIRDKLVIDEDEEIYMPAVDFKDKKPGEIKDTGIKLVKIYYNTVLSTIMPNEVEVRKTALYDGIPIIYRIDLIDWGDTIYDHKVKGRMFSEDELAKDLQSSFYGLVLGREEFDFHYHTAMAVKEPYIKDIILHRTKNDIDWIGKAIKDGWKQIQSGIFLPAPQSAWWCGPNNCGYWGHCRVPSSF